jgi:hypothetical protein
MRAHVLYHKRKIGPGDDDFHAAFAIDADYCAEFIVGQLIWSLQEDAAALLDNCHTHLRLRPDDFLTYARRGLVYRLQGQTAAAESDFAEYVRRSPRGAWILQRLIDEVDRRLS